MAREWNELPFSEAVLLNPATPLARGSVYPFVEMSAIEAGMRDVECSERREFTGGGSRFQNRDTLMARITPCLENGKLARFQAPAGEPVGHGSTEFIVIRGRPNVTDNDYAYYLTISPEVRSFAISQMTGTSGRQRVPTNSLGGLAVPIPPLAEQKAIASILGALDDKIELNRRMNATLEGMARALFRSWFVDFDPVRAKLDGRKPEGLDKAIAALFPDAFEESEAGQIPKGWMACTLSDIAKNVSITFDFKRVSEVVFINTGDVLEGDFLHSNRSPHAGLPGQAKKSIRPEDILFSEIRPANKRYAYVDFDSSDYVVSTKFMIIRGSQEIHPRLLYRILTAKDTLDEFQVQAESRSGTFPQITFDSISHLPIVLPSIGIQEAFQRAVDKMDDQIKVNKQQSRTLANLRDTLLPKLLSGELSVVNFLL